MWPEELTFNIPVVSGPHRRAAGRSSSQTWEVRPGSSVSSEVSLRGYQTFLHHLLHRRRDLHQNEDLRHNCSGGRGKRHDIQPQQLNDTTQCRGAAENAGILCLPPHGEKPTKLG